MANLIQTFCLFKVSQRDFNKAKRNKNGFCSSNDRNNCCWFDVWLFYKLYIKRGFKAFPQIRKAFLITHLNLGGKICVRTI